MDSSAYVAIIDFGSQTTMLIARKIRELGVMATIVPHTTAQQHLQEHPPLAIILSGGFSSVYAEKAPRLDAKILGHHVPVLGICYGMQLLATQLGGLVTPSSHKEFGQRTIEVDTTSLLFDGLNSPLSVWMSHGDQVTLDSPKVKTIAKSPSCPHVALEYTEQKIYGLQFHPEVFHTTKGTEILANFLFKIAGLKPNFSLTNFLDAATSQIKELVQNSHVLMALSGGVDSSVAASLIHRAIGSRLHCVYVDHGLGRLDEVLEIRRLFQEQLRMDCIIIDASEQFFKALQGITDPERKRKIIGGLFIEIFEHESKRWPQVKFLGQGTLYPDVIESSSQGHVIKSHHNVGGLPERMNLHLVEPLRSLFKDEARAVGALLGLPPSLIYRQPFPGPGMAVRVVGEVTRDAVQLLKKADWIVRDEIERAMAADIIKQPLWQWFAILLPVSSVGVQGDARSYGKTIVVRAVESQDAMTADWAFLPQDLLQRISNRITNEVSGISRVLYDITQKPPGTIEWE